MTITVLIRRQLFQESQEGTLRAWVVQEGHRGRNLLAGRQLSDVEHAKQEVQGLLYVKFGPDLKIRWQVQV